MRFDHVLIALCAVLFVWGWNAAAERTQAEAGDDGAPIGGAVLGDNDVTRDAAARLGLPEGVTIDPATGLLVGVVLKGDKDTKAVTWDVLKSYEYEAGLANLPDDVATLDDHKVVMLGFQMASYEYDDIREFYLVASHWSCCYGVPAGINGAVHVMLADDSPSLSLTTRPLKVKGKMRVREVKDGGIVMHIYAIEEAHAEEMTW